VIFFGKNGAGFQTRVFLRGPHLVGSIPGKTRGFMERGSGRNFFFVFSSAAAQRPAGGGGGAGAEIKKKPSGPGHARGDSCSGGN